MRREHERARVGANAEAHAAREGAFEHRQRPPGLSPMRNTLPA